MASIFLKLEGNTVKNRIWDFFIVYSEFDYSMREIAKYSRISYTAMKEIWKEFVRRKLVTHTRNVGKAKMYKLNLKNPQVKKFIDYYWAVIESHIEKEFNIKKENYEKSLKYSPSVHSVAASAKNI